MFYIDTLNERIEKVKFTGNAPSPREDFAMILINKRIFVFGGFQEGGVLNDILTIDLITFIWDVLKPEGIFRIYSIYVHLTFYLLLIWLVYLTIKLKNLIRNSSFS